VKPALNGASHGTASWQTGCTGPRTTVPTSAVSLGAAGVPQPVAPQNSAKVNSDAVRTDTLNRFLRSFNSPSKSLPSLHGRPLHLRDKLQFAAARFRSDLPSSSAQDRQRSHRLMIAPAAAGCKCCWKSWRSIMPRSEVR